MGDDEIRSKKCWACSAELRETQQYCTECKSWQNYRKHLNLSSSILSLLIALISVLGVLGPTILNMFSKKDMVVSLVTIGDFYAEMEVFDESSASSVIIDPIFCEYIVRLWNVDPLPGEIQENEFRLQISSKNTFNKINVGQKLNKFGVEIEGRYWADSDIYVPFESMDRMMCTIDEFMKNNSSRMGTDMEYTLSEINRANSKGCLSRVIRNDEIEEVYFRSPSLEGIIVNRILQNRGVTPKYVSAEAEKCRVELE